MSDLCAIIGGSGLYGLTDDFQVENRLKPETPYGVLSAEIETGKFRGRPLVFLPRHGREHTVAPHKINYRANIWALHNVGVTKIIAVNAVGGIGSEYSPGRLAVPDQLIDYTSNREHCFFDGEDQPLKHIDFTWPYSSRLRQRIVDVAARQCIDLVDSGTYGCTNGPRLETAAEVRKIAADGCNMIGMTGMPEAALARELGLEYAAIALVVNWCAGLNEIELNMDEIKEILGQEVDRIRQLALSVVEEIKP